MKHENFTKILAILGLFSLAVAIYIFFVVVQMRHFVIDFSASLGT